LPRPLAVCEKKEKKCKTAAVPALSNLINPSVFLLDQREREKEKKKKEGGRWAKAAKAGKLEKGSKGGHKHMTRWICHNSFFRLQK